MKSHEGVKLPLGRGGPVANFSIVSVLPGLFFLLDPEEFLDPDKLASLFPHLLFRLSYLSFRFLLLFEHVFAEGFGSSDDDGERFLTLRILGGKTGEFFVDQNTEGCARSFEFLSGSFKDVLVILNVLNHVFVV